jgi:RNA polymerase sigma-70 factor (ECF subfamily)
MRRSASGETPGAPSNKAAPREPGANGAETATDDARQRSDAELVAAVLAGDAEAFGHLYERHVDAVARLVALRLPGADVVEDLTHEVFIKALHGLPGLREPDNFKAWLLSIARNSANNAWRRPEQEGGAPLSERLPAPQNDIGEAETRLGILALLARATDLTDAQRDVLALRFGAGLSAREVADLVGRSPEAVKQLQYRALLVLRSLMTDDGP